MPNDIIAIASNKATQDALDILIEEVHMMKHDVALLSGRVELTMRLLARVVAKMDPGMLDDPLDPETKRRSDLLGKTVINKLREEALAQASADPEAFDRLQRWFRTIL